MESGECSTSNIFDRITPYASSASRPVMKRRFDVFINHRGCDTKHTLASTIYHTLDMINIRAFLDEEELELGDSIPVEIQDAMRTAGVHIAIFSERYAESPWCLAELCYMLQTGTPIIPVFYHVKISDLRRVDDGRYSVAFSQHKKKDRYSSNMLRDWEMALQKASNLSGHVLDKNIGDEGMLLKSIVYSVISMIKNEPLEVAKHPVGMGEIVQDFERNLQKIVENEEGVQIVGIAGFGGSGKTTLATELYNREKSYFKRSSIVHDVRDAAFRNVLHTKQKKLLEDLHIRTPPFENREHGKAFIADRLKNVSVFIVLDDVDHEDQLDALLPAKERLGRGSIVIITTRFLDVLTKSGITSIYKMKPLQDHHAKQLFCWHAFLQPLPLQGFEDIVESFIISCKGLPLSLKVIAGQLYSQRSKDYWVCQLKKFQRILPKEVKERLKISYDALDDDEKEVFLDVACFFIDERKDMAIDVWDASGWSGLCSWEALHNKCLVESYKLGKQEWIRMHDHLRDLGTEIAKTHAPERKFEGGPCTGIKQSRDGKARSKWHQSRDIIPKEELAETLSGALWLKFDRSIPSWFSVDTIANLELGWGQSLETLWEDANPPLQLRALEVWCAVKLESLPRSIGLLQYLKRLSLQVVSSLSSLPEEFCELRLLEHLDLRWGCALSSLPNHFGNLVKLRHLNLDGCKRIERFPESFKQLINLNFLSLCGCKSLQSLDNIANVKALYFYDGMILDVSVGGLSLYFDTDCIGKFLPTICQLYGLQELNIDLAKTRVLTNFLTKSLGELPNFLRNISTLTSLTLKYSNDSPEEYEFSEISYLQNLLIESRSLARSVSLTGVEGKECNNLYKLEGFEHLTSLEKLVLWERKPKIQSFRGLERLQKLNLRLQNISVFADCIQSMEREKWPLEMTICGEANSFSQCNFKVVLDSFTSPGVAVHSMRKWSLISKKHLSCSNATVVCHLFKDQRWAYVIDKYWFHSMPRELKFREPWWEGWIGISVFKKGFLYAVKDGLLSLDAPDKGKVKEVLDREVLDREILDGWVMVGKRGHIFNAFKRLFQALCDCETQL